MTIEFFLEYKVDLTFKSNVINLLTKNKNMITSVETGNTFDKIQYPFIMKEKEKLSELY